MEPDLDIRKSLNTLCDPFLDKIKYDDYNAFCNQLTKIAQEKIDTLVKERQRMIKSLLKNRIPFSNLSESFTTRILQKAFFENKTADAFIILENLIENDCSEKKIIPDSPEWNDWRLMTEHMSIKGIASAMHHFFNLYRLTSTPLFKECFLTLIYLFFNIKNQSIAAKNRSDRIMIPKAVKNTLGLINWKENSKNTRFIELSILPFGTRTIPNLYTLYDNEHFFQYILGALHTIPFARWKYKGAVLENLFAGLSEKNRCLLIQCLIKADCDAKTKRIGEIADRIASTANFSEIAPDLTAYRELNPQKTEENFQLFGWPCPNFTIDRQTGSEARHLNRSFLGATRCKGLVICLYHSNNPKLQSSTWFLGYNLPYEKLVWGTALEQIPFFMQKTPLGIAYLYKNSQDLHFINPESKEEFFKLRLPAPVEKGDEIAVTPSGFCFLACGDKLYGGQMTRNSWKTKFIKNRPRSRMKLFGQTAGFSNYGLDDKVLISNGKTITIHNCWDFHCAGGLVYTLRLQNSPPDTTMIISKHKLKKGKLTKSLEDFQFNAGLLRFFDIIDDNTFIFKNSDHKLVLFNFKTKENRIINQFSANHKHYIDKEAKRIWSWDLRSKELWKHSQEQSRRIAVLDDVSDARLAFADKDQTLYYLG